MLSPTTLLLAGTGLAAAVTIIPVSVGKSGLTFAPDVIRAQVGDVIEFRYWLLNYSVVAGDFSHACRPAASNGFFSGFFLTRAGTVNAQVFRVTVDHTDPVPIYCSQNTGQHCKNGMVAVINPAEAGSLTRNAGNAISPAGGPFGGMVAPNPAASSGASGGGSSTASSTAASGIRAWSQSQTQTRCQSQSQITAPSATTTGTGTRGASATTSGPTGTGNAAAGVTAPVAELVVMAIGALLV